MLTCLQCGKQYCQECITETRDTYYCPDCHREHVSDLASKLSVGEPGPKTKKEKRKGMRAEEAAIPGLLGQLEAPAPLTEPEPPKEPAAPSVQIEPGPSEPSPERPEPPKEHMVAEVLQQPVPSTAIEPGTAQVEPREVTKPEESGRVETGLPKVVVPAPEPRETMPAPRVSDKPAAPPAPGAARRVTEPAPAKEPQPVTPEIPKQQEPPAEPLREIRTEEVPEVVAPEAANNSPLGIAKSPKREKVTPPREQQKKLRRPVEKPGGAPPPQSLSDDERAAFWGDTEKPRWKDRHAEMRAPLPGPPEKEPERPEPESKPAQGAAATPVARHEGAGVTSKEEVETVPPKAERAEITSKEDVAKTAPEETAVKATPTGDEQDLVRESSTRIEEREQVIPPDEVGVKDHFAPRLPKLGAHRLAKRARTSTTVALQIPEDYEGAVTWDPTYLKAVLFGLLAGLLLAGAYAGFEWWRHSGRWILGWVIGFVVGIVVVFASGRHFNWQLGVISALITWFSLCIGQIVFSMLDVRFNNVFPLKLPFPTLLHQSLSELWSTLGSLWLIMLIIAGLVAFLVSFRPWPVRFQISPPEGEGISPESSEPGKVARPGA
jgi:hypothetical protein